MADKVTDTILDDRKSKAAWRRNRDLHVLLLMESYSITRPDAEVLAYYEGIEGLQKLRAGPRDAWVPPQGD